MVALTAAKARQTRTRRTPKPSANPISPLIAESPVDKLDKYFGQLDLSSEHYNPKRFSEKYAPGLVSSGPETSS